MPVRRPFTKSGTVLDQQAGWNGSGNNSLLGSGFSMMLQEIIEASKLLDRAVHNSRAPDNTAGADRHLEAIDDRRAHCNRGDAPVERSITVFGAIFHGPGAAWPTSSSRSEALGEAPMLSIHSCTSTRNAGCAIGSRLG